MSQITLDINYIKSIKNKIEKLETTEQYEIIKILNKNNYKYTKNNNGYFINMNNIPETLMDEIEQFIKFSNENNEKLLNEQNERKNLSCLNKN